MPVAGAVHIGEVLVARELAMLRGETAAEVGPTYVVRIGVMASTQTQPLPKHHTDPLDAARGVYPIEHGSPAPLQDSFSETDHA